MSVIAIVNRKGGAGKSTLATHVAAYLAAMGHDVMLGDVDKQQSSRLWLNLRPPSAPRIQGWTIDERNFARPPAGVKHVVLDTPGGFQGLGLMKVAQYADAILIPATTSLFDRTAAEEGVRELRALPRVVTGKCQLGCVGMRIDARTRSAEQLRAWCEALAVPYLGTIKSSSAYSKCLELGLSIFDLPARKTENLLPEWQALIDWLQGVLDYRLPEPRIVRPVDGQRVAPRAEAMAQPQNSSDMPEAYTSSARTQSSVASLAASSLSAQVSPPLPNFLRR